VWWFPCVLPATRGGTNSWIAVHVGLEIKQELFSKIINTKRAGGVAGKEIHVAYIITSICFLLPFKKPEVVSPLGF
jgi:hypothetical protein